MADLSSAEFPELTVSGFNDYNTALQTSALQATKRAVALPSDLGFHRSIDRTLAKELDVCSARVFAITNRLLALVATAETTGARWKGKARLESEEDVVDSFQAIVVDPMDQLLERTDICLDEFLGRSKPPAIVVNPVQPTVKKPKKTTVPPGRLDPALHHASHLAKPQLSFKRPVDNSNHTDRQPTLKHKFNAQVPLGYSFRDEDSEEDFSGLSVHHLYRYEIKHIPYPSRMFASAPPISPRSFEETPFTWVADPASFDAMLDKLRGAREIAIDLEHHSYRTFSGFVCLMQLSTREEDFVVDTLAVREEMEALNEVFTDPNIVKVLHGAESDIVWLQQDFNLYIVNLFDTYHASKVLDFPRHSLATLLEMYCDFTADKRYQLADWRIRPLPEEMLMYARSDTHFLLYIYDNLRNALLDRAQSRVQSRDQSPSASVSALATAPASPPANAAHALVREVLSRSEETALRVYRKEIYDVEGGSGPGGWDTLAKKWNKGALMAGLPEGTGAGIWVRRKVYRSVHAWRDRVAREEDESTRYVMSNQYLFVLAERPPADMAALLSVFQSVPPVIRRRSKELLDVIRDAVKQALGEDAQPKTAEAATAAEAPSEKEQIRRENDDGIMHVDGGGMMSGAQATGGSALTSLWSRVSLPLDVAQSSSLFGDSAVLTKVDIKSKTRCAAPRSALFGDRANAGPLTQRNRDNKARFEEAIARIHGTLWVAPTLPQVPAGDQRIGAEDAREMDGGNADGTILKEAVEMPFVPAAQRRPSERAEMIDDAIVVVGQARAKKRKRGGKSAAGKGREELGEVEMFDYGSVSNILDEGSEPERKEKGSKKKKQESRGGPGYQYGDFPAPPKAHSQPKSGNQTHTYR